MTPYDPDLERGLHNRRDMLGDAWVDQSLGKANAFNAEFQNFITRFAWHEAWSRPGLDRRTRRIIVLVITATQARWEEFELHARGALATPAGTDGHLSPEDIREVLVQVAVYAGVPAANTAMAATLRVMRELGIDPPPASVFEAPRAGAGRAFRTASTPALHYTVHEPAGGREPVRTVVLSHALGCDSGLWEGIVPALARTCRVVCYDHRGHGLSDTPAGPYTMAELADDARRLLDELHQRHATGPVAWIGLSLGGMVGQELALRHPGRLDALVIANSSSRYGEEGRAQWRTRIATLQSRGLEAIADAAMERWFSAAFRAASPARVARWRRRLVGTPLAGYIGACHAVMNLDTTDRLPDLGIPVLVIAGEQDQGTPVAMAEAIAGAIPGARLAVLDGVAHLSVLEDPAGFLALAGPFLGGA